VAFRLRVEHAGSLSLSVMIIYCRTHQYGADPAHFSALLPSLSSSQSAIFPIPKPSFATENSCPLFQPTFYNKLAMHCKARRESIEHLLNEDMDMTEKLKATPGVHL
jgi:hypothetical protein